MKDFHAWLSDLTIDLRAGIEPPKEPKADTKVDPNSIHDALISAIKSVAWRAQNQIPMEDRIEKKLANLRTLYGKISLQIDREVKQGLRHPNELKELAARTGAWVDKVNKATMNINAGDIPIWPHKDQYVPFHIKH